MITVTGWRPRVARASTSARDRVATQLDVLADGFGVGAQAPVIRAVYRVICRRSLDFPRDKGPAVPSRLNPDGVPIQFATTVGPRPAPVRFVADPGPFGAEGGAGMRTARATMREAAELLGTEAEFATLTTLLDELAPEDAPALRADPAGAFWIGAAFAPGASPRLRVYVNGGWDGPPPRSAFLHRFAAHFHRTDGWDDLTARIPAALTTLGVALTLARGEPVRGTIYLRAFGLRLSDYESVARTVSGNANAERIHDFGAALLGDDAAHPAPSAVLSFGLGPQPGLLTELELCAHCLYADDDAARAALERLFASTHLDPAPYRALAHALAPLAPRPGPPRLHSFVGVEAKSTGPAFTVYLSPDLSAVR